jgi:N-formylglutamate amidohydrolase
LQWKETTGIEWRDTGTRDIALATEKRLAESGIFPTILWFAVHRSHVDVNRSPEREPYHRGFGESYGAFHAALDGAIERALERFGSCLLVDLHGYGRPPGPETYDVVLGSDEHATSPRQCDRAIAASLSQAYRTVFSPDPARQVSRIYRGGWIVRRTSAAYKERGLDAVQIEFNEHLRRADEIPTVATHLARALATALIP